MTPFDPVQFLIAFLLFLLQFFLGGGTGLSGMFDWFNFDK